MMWSFDLIVSKPFPSLIFFSTNMDATEAVMKERSTGPLSIIIRANIFPALETGTISPYPTVAMVTMAQYKASNIPVAPLVM